MRTLRAASSALIGIAVLACNVGPARAVDAVTQWSEFAIDPRRGDYHWHSVVLVHAAMHDTLNAIRPRYGRWTPANADEPPAAGALPEAAVAAAAHTVLTLERDGQGPAIDAMLERALVAVPDGPGKSAGVALGRAIGVATVSRRSRDWDVSVKPFPTGTEAGVWRAAPPFFRIAMTARYEPFAFGPGEEAPLPLPPVLGSAAYLEAVAEVRELGARNSTRRTPAQTRAAFYWADQNSQRNFHALAVRLLASRPPPHDLWESARSMALLSFALTDSFVLAWAAKERFGFWRPITAIHEGGFGVAADPDWRPLVTTPAHPDHPSGHAIDCSAGAHVLEKLLALGEQPVRYVAVDADGSPGREYAGLIAIAEECAASRLWAGVHFRTANEAGSHLGRAIAERVVGTLLQPVPAR